RIAETAAELVEHFTRALNVDFVGNLHRQAEIGPVRAVGTAERIAAVIAGTLARLRFGALHHLLGHGLRTLSQPVERKRLLLRCPLEVAVADRLLGVAHGFARVGKASRRFGPFEAEAVDHLLQHVAELLLPLGKLAVLARSLRPDLELALLARTALTARLAL